MVHPIRKALVKARRIMCPVARIAIRTSRGFALVAIPRMPRPDSLPSCAGIAIVNSMAAHTKPKKSVAVARAVVEVGFIIFLFYSNLLMGEFVRSGMGQKRGVAWAIGDVFTVANFEIAKIAAL